MKAIKIILLAPIIGLMWLVIRMCIAITYVSGIALSFVSGVFVLASIAHFLAGSTVNGCIGLVIAFLLCPYGIPMFCIRLLGAIEQVRFGLMSCISK